MMLARLAFQICLVLACALVLIGCASTGPSGTMSDVKTQWVTKADSAYSFDTVLADRGLVVETNPSGHLLVSRVPGMKTARDAGFPFVLVLTLRAPDERTHTTSLAVGNTSAQEMFGNTAGFLDGMTVTVQLYDTRDESGLWVGQFAMDGAVSSDRIVRRLEAQMQSDGVLSAQESETGDYP